MKMSSSDSKEGYNPRVTDVHEIQVNVQEISLLLEELKRIKGLKTEIIYEKTKSIFFYIPLVNMIFKNPVKLPHTYKIH